MSPENAGPEGAGSKGPGSDGDTSNGAEPENESFDAQIDGFPRPHDAAGLRARLPVEILASQFVDEIRSGGSPTVEDYANTYRKLADEIRDLFPAILAMEQLKSEEEATALRDQVRGEFNIKELGGCRIVREVGRGGMGVVFQAIEHKSRRAVAIKLLPWPSDAVPRWRKRFQDEARLSAKLQHKNIVPIYDSGEQDGYCYLMMRLINGVSLDQVITALSNSGVANFDELRAKQQNRTVDSLPKTSKTEPLIIQQNEWRHFAKIALETTLALQHAHEAGTLHNDIKPGNLLIDISGKTWVTDFGLAHALEADAVDDEGRVTGTLRYMAPERFAGKTDARTDVYSLGATLYELLTLQPMFDADSNKALMEKVVTRSPMRPCDIESTIPRELEAIVLKAIARNPNERYQTAAEMSVDLSQYLNDQSGQQQKRGTFGRVIDRWRTDG